MTVQEVLMGAGKWELSLVPDTPQSLLGRIAPANALFGQVVITPVPVDVTLGDAILPVARYTGVYRDQPSRYRIGGPGLAAVISDEDGKGPAYVTGINTPGAPVTHTFADWAALLKPSSLTAGVTGSSSTLYGKVWPRATLRAPLDEMCAFYGVEWRVTNDFHFDLAPASALYRTTPKAVIVAKKGDGGSDLNLRGIVGDLNLARDGDDIVRRVVLFSGSSSSPTITISSSGIANNDYPYRNVDGTSLTMDQLVEDWQVQVGDEPNTVQGLFENRRGLHQEITLNSLAYDIAADVEVGDNLYVYDMLRGIYDLTNPIQYRGETIYPQTIRCVGYTWPIRRGMGVYLRHYIKVGSSWVVEWIDLTRYVQWETGTTSVEVGDKARITV